MGSITRIIPTINNSMVGSKLPVRGTLCVPLGEAMSVGSSVTDGRGIVGEIILCVGEGTVGVRLADGVASPNTCVPLLKTVNVCLSVIFFPLSSIL